MWSSKLARLIAALVFALGSLGSLSARADTPRADGHTYAVLVGVANYPSSPLPRTDVDAARIARALQRHVPEERLDVQLLLNEQATRANVDRALSHVARRATPRDEVIFFFSGHGGTEPDEADGDEGDGVDETIVLYDGSLRDDELAASLRRIRSRMSIVALDSCFSGGFLFDVTNERGRMGLFSSDEDLTSAVPSQEAGGWLSLYLAEALEGRADGVADGAAGQSRDGQLTALEIELYIRDRARSQQRISASDPASRSVGFQFIDVKRVGVAPDAVFMALGGPVAGGVERHVLLERDGITLAATNDFTATPSIGLDLSPGHTYVIETFGLQGATDTVLELRRRAGDQPSPSDPIVAENDDDGASLASRVRWMPDAAGSYYAHVRPYAASTGGTFGLRVVELRESAGETTTPERPVPSANVLFERADLSLPASASAPAPAIELTLEAGQTYVIETFGLDATADTVLELRRGAADGHAGSAVVAENDDHEGLASRVEWTADASGVYHVVTRSYSPGVGGRFGLRVVAMR